MRRLLGRVAAITNDHARRPVAAAVSRGDVLLKVRRSVWPWAFRAFLLLDRLGLHVLPKHYYTSIPDHAWLRQHTPLWQRTAPLTGIDWSLEAQAAWLERTVRDHRVEASEADLSGRFGSRAIGHGFPTVESQVLYCFIRSLHPRRVVEVGGGASTAVMAAARRANLDDGQPDTAIVTIEPYPAPSLLQLEGVTVIREHMQAVSGSVFGRLDRGDLLFIDSSHAVKTGAETVRLYLEMIPGLREGVYVHVHDVNLPYLYSPFVLTSFFDWQETTLLTALLTNNSRLEVLCSLSALHYELPDTLARILPGYRPQATRAGLLVGGLDRDLPSSLWLRVREAPDDRGRP
jgi:predicted O-methyltransferase YrrM